MNRSSVRVDTRSGFVLFIAVSPMFRRRLKSRCLLNIYELLTEGKMYIEKERIEMK